MKRTKKYSSALVLLTFPHKNQDELYQELNRLGWYWDSKKQKWERNNQLADPPTNLIKVRVWAATDKVKQAAEIFIEQAEAYDLQLLEQSESFVCRPPKQLESRIYLTFQDNSEINKV